MIPGLLIFMQDLNITVREVKETLENRLGSKLAEIVQIIKEVNFEVLNNSEEAYFELITNNNPYSEFIFSEETSVINAYIKFVWCNIGAIYYFLDSNPDKMSVLKWITDILISSNLEI